MINLKPTTNINLQVKGNSYIAKLKHILPTFFIMVFSTVIGLAIFRWLFCIQFLLLDIKEEVWELWIPIIFPWIPITIWMRQRFRVLTFEMNEDRKRIPYQMICWFVMTAMLLVSQAYLTTATGKLQTLSTIQDIEKSEGSRFYKLSNFRIAPDYDGSFTDFTTSGKYSQYLNIDVFFATPILNDTTEQITSIPRYWYGLKYHKQISNKISDEEKDKAYDSFYNECVQKLNDHDFHSLDHFERLPNSDDRKHYLKAIEARTNEPANKSFIVLKPIHEKYEERNGNKFAWIFGSFAIGLFTLLLALILPGYSETERKKFLLGQKPEQDDLADMLDYLIPKEEHFVTSIIIDVNILVFLLMAFSGINILSPHGNELLDWGANRRTETTNGEWWRLLSSMFLHGGIMHLLLNIFGLVLAALLVEPLLGRRNYSILYILSGLCASAASIGWYTNTVSVGASGAIFGLYGAILGLLLTDAFPKDSRKGLFKMIGVYVLINLLWGFTGGIDNAAHVGGLLSGAILGIALYKLTNKKNGYAEQ